MRVLVSGGAGYIGSVMTRMLLDEGIEVVVADDLSGGHREAVDPRAELVEADLADPTALGSLFDHGPYDAALHFAGVISMAESMRDPGKYFRGNFSCSLKLAEALVSNGVGRLIFSSTAGVYGNPHEVPIPESHPKSPTNPYGESKLMVEGMLGWFGEIYPLRSVCLRYFNAAGATLDTALGEGHEPETHIIPLALDAVLGGRQFKLFGDDYDTPDGTCVRDYIHVEDLCRAHLLALAALEDGHPGGVFNVGTGKGVSNREVVRAVEHAAGARLDLAVEGRRPGDAGELVADPTLIEKELGWKPAVSDIETIVRTACEYMLKTRG